MSFEKFQDFITKLGLKKEVATELWNANICSPQELAGKTLAELQTVTKNSLLLNSFHPVLHDNAVAIAMSAHSADPYEEVIGILRKHAQSKKGRDTAASDSVVSDATAYVESSATSNLQTRQRVDVSSPGNSTSPSVIKSTLAGGGQNSPGGIRLNFSGNITQAAILSDNITFNNTNTSITATSTRSVNERNPEQPVIVVDPGIIDDARFRWRDNSDFCIANVNIPRSDVQMYTRHMAEDDVYKTHGRRRALILNITSFTDGVTPARGGAENDGSNMENIFRKLGFVVQCENNKRASEIKELVRDFAISIENMRADMVAIYIGSHGERDGQGNDTFLGTDCQRVNLGELKDLFSPQNSPLLRDKPKIFFLQFCREDAAGSNIAAAEFQQLSSDAIGFVDDTRPMDMVCTFATIAGSKAYRRVPEGSWFVTALIRALTENSDKDDLLSMLTKVNNYVSFEAGTDERGQVVQISEVVHNLRKKIFFYPGLGDTP